MSQKNQMTGNAALYHVACKLSRLGWNVMLTIRNAQGADMYAASPDETVVLPIQSKGLKKRDSVPLGKDLDRLRSDWWVITVRAMDVEPVCYIMTLEEVKARATQDTKGSWWLCPAIPKYAHITYETDEYREAWHRLDPIRN